MQIEEENNYEIKRKNDAFICGVCAELINKKNDNASSQIIVV